MELPSENTNLNVDEEKKFINGTEEETKHENFYNCNVKPPSLEIEPKINFEENTKSSCCSSMIKTNNSNCLLI